MPQPVLQSDLWELIPIITLVVMASAANWFGQRREAEESREVLDELDRDLGDLPGSEAPSPRAQTHRADPTDWQDQLRRFLQENMAPPEPPQQPTVPPPIPTTQSSSPATDPPLKPAADVFIKGWCTHCNGPIEFPTQAITGGKSIDCPHCGQPTCPQVVREAKPLPLQPFPGRRGGADFGWIHSLARDPVSARRAFLAMEVFGPPRASLGDIRAEPTHW